MKKPLADPYVESGNRDEIPSRRSGRPERPLAEDRNLNKAHESWRGSLREPLDRPGAGSGYRGRDRFIPRQAHQPPRGGGHFEKWKHDETNRSPTTKNEEDQISKIEALLAS